MKVRGEGMTILLILLAFFGLLFLGMPIAFVIGIVVSLILVLHGFALDILVQRMFASVNNFSYLAIPLFKLAGNIMAEDGLTKRLMAFSKMLVGKLTGGTAITTVITTALFGTVSGSTVANNAVEIT